MSTHLAACAMASGPESFFHRDFWCANHNETRTTTAQDHSSFCTELIFLPVPRRTQDEVPIDPATNTGWPIFLYLRQSHAYEEQQAYSHAQGYLSPRFMV